MTLPVGIDNLNLYASTLYVDFAEIASVRGYPEKDFKNIGFLRRSVVPPYEDPVTLAVNAAKPLIDAVDKDQFELLIVATETGVDYGKPLSSYVHKYLDLGHLCRNFELKHACYAGTAALQMAASWIRSDAAPGKSALVIMTDIGRRHFAEPAELSVGAAAVALTISANPRVFMLEPHCGYASHEVYDTARPTPTSEWIDPPLSLGSYLDIFEIALQEYRRATNPPSFHDHFDFMIYHTPLLSLIQQAHKLAIEVDEFDLDLDEFTASFDRMVGPSLRYNQEIGNTYSGSLYAALAAIVDSTPPRPENRRVGCFSYGSGACGEVFSGLIGPEARDTLSPRQIDKNLAARRKTSIQEYETAVLEVERSLIAVDYEPDWEYLNGHFEQFYREKNILVLESVKNHYRNYRWS